MAGKRVLVVDDDVMIRVLARAILTAEGYDVDVASSGIDALAYLGVTRPDLIVSDVMMPEMDGFALVSKLRAQPESRDIPVVFLTSKVNPSDSRTGLRLGPGDYIEKPFSPDGLIANVAAHLSRAPRRIEHLLAVMDARLVPAGTAREELDSRLAQRTATGVVAVVALDEQPMLDARWGSLARDDVAARVAPLLRSQFPAAVMESPDSRGFRLWIPEADAARVRARLAGVAQEVAEHPTSVGGEPVRITLTVGIAEVAAMQGTAAEFFRRAYVAADASSAHLDLQPVLWDPTLDMSQADAAPRRTSRWRSALSTPVQVAVTFALGVVGPFLTYVWLYHLGIQVSTPMYVAIVIALAGTGGLIWSEGFYALDPIRPPREPGAPPPPATAIIAAYLPNEAATIVATVESFLRIDYPDLQVIVAYNTPRGLLVERVLHEIAARDRRLVPLRVEGSTSKAQNVNAALSVARGEFIGLYDADHQPHPDSFSRAWRWLSNGYDVVQGHCVIRNGSASVTARTVAVEFEAIYAVSHPGRWQLHGFGIFGGSNGFWRTEVLRRTRMHGFMLTEDIDSSLRVIADGGKIANDPGLLSYELAPSQWGQLWNQRMRWAQGWFQVSRKHLSRAWGSRTLSLRQKAGMTMLLGWREVYPWISLQMFPLIAFIAWRDGGLDRLDWFIAIFVLSTLFTLSVGPGQALFAWRLAAPEVKRHRSWFWWYLLFASVFYSEWKNIIARVAQLKELMGERQWKITPRTAGRASQAA